MFEIPYRYRYPETPVKNPEPTATFSAPMLVAKNNDLVVVRQRPAGPKG